MTVTLAPSLLMESLSAPPLIRVERPLFEMVSSPPPELTVTLLPVLLIESFKLVPLIGTPLVAL